MRQIKKGSTDRAIILRIIDSTSGAPETAVTFETAGIAMWYRREGATVTAITEVALASADAAHSDGGIIHLSDGYYRLDLPDAAFATGANHVMVGGAVTGMIVIGQEVQLVNYDPEDTVRLGLTALPNAAADAAGGLAISDAGGLDLDTLLGRILGTIAAGTHVAQSGDAYSRLGAPSGASVSADIADVPTVSEFNARTLVAADYTIVSDLPVAPDNASIAAILLDTGTDGVLLAAGAVDAIHDEVVEGTTTFRQAMRLVMSALFGKVSGAPTGPIVFRDIGDTKTRISATVDADGNRTAVTKDAT